jgi:23S rRNA pseudouridine1911/1915/1917 synthase
MVVAKEKTAHANLMRQFEAGTVKKEYLAVVKGRVEQEKFEVSGFLGRDPNSRISVRHALVPAGTGHARDSLTRFERVRELDGATLLRCLPETGRTNQIRVHLASVGHPVVGDKLYGRTDEEFLEFIRYVKAGGDPAYPGHAEVPRHLLHAFRLSFDHPVTGERVTFQAEMPGDMRGYIDQRRGATTDSR